MLTFKAFGITDIGNFREKNEDSFLIEKFKCEGNSNCLLIAVADGVGGAKAGETASKIAVETVKRVMLNTQGLKIDALKTSIESANKIIYEMSLKDENYRGMATTFTAIVFMENTFILGHIGDSRTYIVRNNDIKLLTEDHTVVNRLFKDGFITKEERRYHPQRNVLSKALGVQEIISYDISHDNIYKDDIFMICTDGLYKYIEENEIKDIVKNMPIESSAEYLVNTAKERGGDDNISVVLVKVDSPFDERKTAKITETVLPMKDNNKRKTIYAIILVIVIVGIYLILGGGGQYNKFFCR